MVVHQAADGHVCLSPTEDGEEREKVKKAGDCCKKILNHVNQAVKEAENKQVRITENHLSVRVKAFFMVTLEVWRFYMIKPRFIPVRRAYQEFCCFSTEVRGLSEKVRRLVTQTE